MLDQIRGRTYEDALMILEFLPYRSCEDITATLISVRGIFGAQAACSDTSCKAVLVAGGLKCQEQQWR